jgi:hemolysin activation/secretion protein
MMKKNVLWWICVALGVCLVAMGSAFAQDATFEVLEYRVEGTTLLPTATVEKAVYPFLGENKTIADVELARESLEKAYADAGYLTVLVSIPPQEVKKGVGLVVLQVTEAPVDRLRVVESRYYSLGQIKAGVPELAEGNVPNFNQMQDELATLSRSADRRITPVLRPGKPPGTVEVDLKVDDQLPFHGYLNLASRYTENTIPPRILAGLRWDNLWGKQQTIGMEVQTIPGRPDVGGVLTLAYAKTLESGNIVSAYGMKVDTNIVAFDTVGVVGKSLIYGTRYTMVLPGQDSFSHTAAVGADYKDITQSITLINAGGFDSPITYMPLMAGWNGNWQGKGNTTKAGLAFHFHPRGFTGSAQQFADKRYKGEPGYSLFRGSFERDQTLGEDWKLSARSTWQYTVDPLISDEQFVIGGMDTVRGYLEGAAVGDTGIALTLEASTPSFAKWFNESLDEARVVAFIDSATVTVIEPITATGRFSLTGVGVGLRLKAWRGAAAQLDWATAMDDAGSTKKGDSRVYFKVGYEW